MASLETKENKEYEGMVRFTLEQLRFCHEQAQTDFKRGNKTEGSLRLASAVFDIFPMLPATAIIDAISLPFIFGIRRLRQQPKQI